MDIRELGVPPAPYFPTRNNHNHNPPEVRYRVPENDQKHSDDEAKDIGKKPISKPVPILRLLMDIILLTLAFVPVILLNTLNKPFIRGFYCNDESIRYPYKEDTITPLTLYTVGAAIVIATVLILETVITLTTHNGRHIMYSIRGKSVHPLMSSIYVYLGYCAAGFTMLQIATDIFKNMVGRLRPHFISACDPDWDKINCTHHSYIENPHCLNDNEKIIQEARYSFLSGHASYSAYMMFYLVLYLQARWRWPGCSLLGKHFLQFAFVMLSLFTGLSRISDYKHHWSDIMAGFALGVLVACLIAIHVGNFFKREMHTLANGVVKTQNGVATLVYPGMFGVKYAPNDGKHVY